MDDQQLRDLLVRAAELPGGPIGAPAGLARRVRRRRVRVRSLSFVGVAIVVAAATAVPTIALQSGASRRAPVTPAESVAPAPPVSKAGTAAALAADEWTELPPAPIAGRSPAAAVWDGAQMLVWGGAVGSTLFSDGAAYDPVGHVWTKLPPSPLSARSDSAYVWTGHDLFVWGGLDSNTGSGHYANDGALYDPSTRAWRMLPPAPLPASVAPTALLVGDHVVVLSGRNPQSDGFSGAAAAYDPAHSSWHRIAPLPLTQQGQVSTITATSTGRSIVAWESWVHTTELTHSSFSSFAGLATYRYDAPRNRWASVRTVGTGPAFRVPRALWTGRQLIAPGTDGCPPGASCPATIKGRAYALNPRDETWTALPLAPIADVGSSSIWTGTALVEFNSGTVFTGVGPGAAAAWDPVTDDWTTLPTAPYAGNDTAAVWAGRSLLVWGPMSRASDFDGTHPPAVSTVGLELGPVPTTVGRPRMSTP